MIDIDKTIENERKMELKVDRASYDRRMSEKYPDKEYRLEQADLARQRHRNQGIKYLGFGAAAALGAIIFFDGFIAGAATVLAVGIAIFAHHQHTEATPSLSELVDLRSEEEKLEGHELSKRENNPDYDRKRWIKKNQASIDGWMERNNAENYNPKRVADISECNRPSLLLTLAHEASGAVVADDEIYTRENLKWLKLEKLNEDGSSDEIEIKEYRDWPMDWTYDSLHSDAQEACIPAYYIFTRVISTL